MPSAVTHFYSGQPMHFCSGVDTAFTFPTLHALFGVERAVGPRAKPVIAVSAGTR